MFHITICHPLSPNRIHDGMEDALDFLKKEWDENIRRFRRVHQESAASVKLFPVPLSSLGGWHPDSHHSDRIYCGYHCFARLLFCSLRPEHYVLVTKPLRKDQIMSRKQLCEKKLVGTCDAHCPYGRDSLRRYS